MAGDDDFGYSLHHIDEEFDTGAVIDIRKKMLLITVRLSWGIWRMFMAL